MFSSLSLSTELQRLLREVRLWWLLCAGFGPLKAQMLLETCAIFLVALSLTIVLCLGLANQDGGAPFSI